MLFIMNGPRAQKNENERLKNNTSRSGAKKMGVIQEKNLKFSKN